MAIYDFNGNPLALSNDIYIKDIKEKYPSYNDDQLLDAAISSAKIIGASSRIIWDGTDIHFSGSTTHECKGFGGIDFNGSKIYMPNYDNGVILSIVPDVTSELSISGSVFGKNGVTDAALKDKVFSVFGNNSGLCLGTRQGFGTIQNWRPTLKTSADGKYETGELFLVPTEANVTLSNIHEYPAKTFQLCNATIITYDSTNMSTFVSCSRSNTRIYNFVLQGRSRVNTYHSGVFVCISCCDVEVDHISGINPIVESLTSGYFLLLGSMTNVHVHDCFVGDGLSWGSVGCNHLINTVFERCYLNRWDCHYCQNGYNIIRDCILGNLEYGIGDGMIDVQDCIFQNRKTSNAVLFPIFLREDIVGVYEGNITIRNCIFDRGEQPASQYVLWRDACVYAKPSDSVVNSEPYALRHLEKCRILDGCKNLIVIGTNTSADKGMYSHVRVFINNTDIICSDTIVDAVGSAQDAIEEIAIDGCVIQSQCYVTKLLTNTPVKVSKCNFGINALKIASNSAELHVTDTKLSNITADASSAKLVANGNVFSSTQAVTSFTSYALAGNIASDMASVNKHSN